MELAFLLHIFSISLVLFNSQGLYVVPDNDALDIFSSIIDVAFFQLKREMKLFS